MAHNMDGWQRGQVDVRCTRRRVWSNQIHRRVFFASKPVAVVLLLLFALCTLSCETLIGADFGKRYKLTVQGQLADGGVNRAEPLKSCQERNCGSFKDNNIEVYCGSCPSEQVCVQNKCTCDPLSCEDLGAECGYRSNGCNRLQYCGACEQLYPNDPPKPIATKTEDVATRRALPRRAKKSKHRGALRNVARSALARPCYRAGSAKVARCARTTNVAGILPSSVRK